MVERVLIQSVSSVFRGFVPEFTPEMLNRARGHIQFGGMHGSYATKCSSLQRERMRLSREAAQAQQRVDAARRIFEEEETT